MPLLTKAAILAAADFKTIDCEVPEWGGTVRLRGMSGAERDAWEAEVMDAREAGKLNYTNFRARLVARCLIDEQGQRLFTDSDIEALGRKSALALMRVFEAAQKLNGLSKGDVEELTEGLKSPA